MMTGKQQQQQQDYLTTASTSLSKADTTGSSSDDCETGTGSDACSTDESSSSASSSSPVVSALLQTQAASQQQPQPQTTRFNFYIPQENTTQQQVMKLTQYQQQQQQQQSTDTDQTMSSSRRFNFYNAAEVQSAETAAAASSFSGAVEGVEAAFSNTNNNKDATATATATAVAPVATTTTMEAEAATDQSARSTTTTTTTTTAAAKSLSRTVGPARAARKKKTPSTSSVDSNEILKSLQETERQQQQQQQQQQQRFHAARQAAVVRASGPTVSATARSPPVAAATATAARSPRSPPVAAATATTASSSNRPESQQQRSSNSSNPYRDAITEALLMLQQNKQTSSTGIGTENKNDNDLVLQLRREQSALANSGITTTTVRTTTAREQAGEEHWIPPLPGAADNNVAEELIRRRSESDDYTSGPLEQHRIASTRTSDGDRVSVTTASGASRTANATEQQRQANLPYLFGNDDDGSTNDYGNGDQQSVDTTTHKSASTAASAAVVSHSVEQILLAILERANNSQHNGDTASAIAAPSSTRRRRQQQQVNHATELDALTTAMDSLWTMQQEGPTLSLDEDDDRGGGGGGTMPMATTRSRRPNRREIEEHALLEQNGDDADASSSLLHSGLLTVSTPEDVVPRKSVLNEFLTVMDDVPTATTTTTTTAAAALPATAEDPSVFDDDLLEVDHQQHDHQQQRVMFQENDDEETSRAGISDYCTPVSSCAEDELPLNESIEVIESTSMTEGIVTASAGASLDSHNDENAVGSASGSSTSLESGSSSTSFEETTETDEYEEEDEDCREESEDESTLSHLLGDRRERTYDDDDDEGEHSDDEVNEKDISLDESTLNNVLGPLSRGAGGTTGVVLEASSEDVQAQTTADDATAPLSPASIYETLSSAVRDAENFMSFVTSGGYPNVNKDKYFTGDDDDETAIAGRSPGGGGGGTPFDADAHELMRSLCAHLLPYGVDKSTQSPRSERVPVWDESNPDEAGYRIIRLSKRQLCAVEGEFDKMVKNVKRTSERDLNGGLSTAETRKDWNGVTDDDFARDLEEAEELLDEEEKRRNDAECAIARTTDDDSGGSTSGSESDSSSQSGTIDGTASPLMSETDDDTMLTSHPDFPGVKTTGKGEIGDLEYFYLPIIYKSNVTGFEPTKDLYLEPGNVIAGQYLVENELGSAAFSTAYRCVDLSSETTTEKGQQSQEEVCLKVIKNTKDFFDQSLDEIKILELLRQTGKCHENHILEMKTFFYHREHLIIVTELLRQNLFEFGKFITDSDEEPYFTRKRLCYITRQVLTALNFVHKMGLVHSDVKPENILLSSYSRAQVKLIDFGSSCYLTDRQSSYIQSRSYRAPEVVLGLPYNGKIDMWSLGCVVAEMYTGEVTFQNDSIVSMLSRIEAICGPFPRHMIAQGRQSNRFFTKSGLLFEYVDSENGDGPPSERPSNSSLLDVFQPKRTTLAARLGIPDVDTEDDAHFIDFCSKLLAVDPDSRPTAAEALKHPWIVAGKSLTEEDIKYPSK